MKVKAILRRRPGGGRRPGPGAPAAGWGSSGRRRPASLAAWPRRAARNERGLRELTGPPRPQPGRERQAALGAAAGPSARPREPTPPCARSPAGSPPPGPGAVSEWGLGREAPSGAPGEGRSSGVPAGSPRRGAAPPWAAARRPVARPGRAAAREAGRPEAWEARAGKGRRRPGHKS